MDYLLELTVWLGLLIIVTAITLSGLIVVTQVKKRIQHKITKQHEKVGRLLFRVTAGLIALLISLSYANEQVKQYKRIDALETDASLLTSAAAKLSILGSEESNIIKKTHLIYPIRVKNM